MVDTLDHLHRYLPLSDIVVGTLPSSPATHHLLTLDDFSRMKPDALFANVGRGDLVALDVLEKVMAQHRIRGMILDVCEIEPLPADCPLWEDENVFITPHISGDESLPETKNVSGRLSAPTCTPSNRENRSFTSSTVRSPIAPERTLDRIQSGRSDSPGRFGPLRLAESGHFCLSPDFSNLEKALHLP
ncbi:NAD(P)-dependent oxidoreductase [Allobaculum sp. Allo2]|uniref:NAD(P)-dependent oxidoreductase n=1 Tax=Allobaculum sp. Allo2 TaxID=2853432 RepID=UPI002112EDD1|nr:NAD(P)-dependent oxidoreductase [Allobaculum sp. Allo2]UNT93666.1 hypothetical protein KWG61_02615 [Allobaculum sp. Allo2]